MSIVISSAAGKVCLFYDGFAVDADKNLYLGKGSAIEVSDSEGDFLRKLSARTSRGYSFTITESNTLKISTGDYLYTTDLFGNLISKKEIQYYADDDLIDLKKAISPLLTARSMQ